MENGSWALLAPDTMATGVSLPEGKAVGARKFYRCNICRI
jgi:hypothetical protein